MSSNNHLKIYLLRHGETAWNRGMRMQGHTDIPLNDIGMEQARLAGLRISQEPLPPEAVYSSDLSRARMTAEAIAAPLGLTVQTMALLRETNLGEWEGLSREEIVARGEEALLARYRSEPHIQRPPGGETLEAAWERMIQALNEIRHAHPSGQVAIVGHGGSLRVFFCDVVGAGVISMHRFWLDNASISIIEEFEQSPAAFRRITLFNDTCHLSAAPFR